MSKKHWRSIVWRWHRRLGLGLFVVLIWVSATGIMLNHTDFFGLDKQPIHQPLLLRIYGIKPPETFSYEVENEWISYSGEYLYHGSVSFTHCLGKFAGLGAAAATAETPTIIAAACGNELVLFTPRGELIERLNTGTFASITRLGQCQSGDVQGICFAAQATHYHLDVTTGRWQETAASIELVALEALPHNLQEQLNRNLVSLSWEQVTLDLHSGQLFGMGPWLMDALAFLLIMLGFSGIGIWLMGKRR